MRGQCLLRCCPLRFEPNDRSEMVTQLLYGEHYTVVEEQSKWLKISLHADNYTGWLSRNQYHEPVFEPVNVQNSLLISDDAEALFPFGCDLPETEIRWSKPIDNLYEASKLFLNTPYLWGGKTFMGIDCSGFTQILFKANGVQIPRDAHQQIEVGEKISFGKHISGDIAFFSNDQGIIIHVGIVGDQHRIIHAAGKVREDILDQQGILNVESKIYSHQLAGIRRIT